MPVTRLRGFLILFAFALSGVRGPRDVISLSLSLLSALPLAAGRRCGGVRSTEH